MPTIIEYTCWLCGTKITEIDLINAGGRTVPVCKGGCDDE